MAEAEISITEIFRRVPFGEDKAECGYFSDLYKPAQANFCVVPTLYDFNISSKGNYVIKEIL